MNNTYPISIPLFSSKNCKHIHFQNIGHLDHFGFIYKKPVSLKTFSTVLRVRQKKLSALATLLFITDAFLIFGWSHNFHNALLTIHNIKINKQSVWQRNRHVVTAQLHKVKKHIILRNNNKQTRRCASLCTATNKKLVTFLF